MFSWTLEFTPAMVSLALRMGCWANRRQNSRLGISTATRASVTAASSTSMASIAPAMPTTLTKLASDKTSTDSDSSSCCTSFWTRDMILPTWLRS